MSRLPLGNWLNKVSLQTVLLVPFVLLTIAAVALVGYFSYRNSQEAVNDVAHQLRSEINARIEGHLSDFLDRPHAVNHINAHAMTIGTLDVTDQKALKQRFWQQVKMIDTITSISFSNTAGGLANAGREGAGGSFYVIYTDNFESGPFYKYFTDNQGNPSILEESLPNFDGRTRSWYTDAVAAGTSIWSEAYILFTGQDMSLSACQPVYSYRGQLMGVIASNIFLSHLGDYLTTLKVGKTGQSFIMEPSGYLIATSTGEKPFIVSDGSEGVYIRLTAANSASPLSAAAARALENQYGSYDAITESDQFEFFLGGARQHGQVTFFQDNYGLEWLIVTVIPETDFMSQVSANNRMTIYLMLGTLAFTVTAAIIITRRILSPIAHLKDSAEALSGGRWDQVAGRPSRIKEISVLTDSFEYMVEQMQRTVTSLTYEVNERQEAEYQLEAKNHELEQVVYIASHDLRSPLVNIDGYGREIEYAVSELNQALSSDDIESVQALKDALKYSVQEMSSAIKYIRTSTLQMDALIKGLLKLSRSGRAALTIETLDMNALLSAVVAAVEFQVKEAGIDLILEELPPCRGDAVQVNQVFSNIIANAIKYTASGRPPVIRVSGKVEGSRSIYCVEDNGVGIEEKNLEIIFEVFEQLNPVSSAGEGLGLTIVRQILQRLGGEIWVESALDSGSRFYIALPAAKN